SLRSLRLKSFDFSRQREEKDSNRKGRGCLDQSNYGAAPRPIRLPVGAQTCLNELMVAAERIRVGTAGWSYKDWEGVFYPPGMSRRKQHPLELVARCFDLVEINTSFYGHIKPEIATLWARIVSDANPNFLFTAKLHRSFTHSPLAAMEPTSAVSIRPNDEDERLAREGLEAMAATGKFGALFIQFPVSFKNTALNREYLETLLRQFIEYPRVVEV